jgi:plastocyanin
LSTTRSFASVAAVLGLLFTSMGPAAAADAPKPVTHTVSIDGTSFQPTAITVKAGDTIVWVNKDPFPHTVTADAGGFDSGAILPGKSWRYTPAKKGEFAYTCTYHPTMKATLSVK